MVLFCDHKHPTHHTPVMVSDSVAHTARDAQGQVLFHGEVMHTVRFYSVYVQFKANGVTQDSQLISKK